MKKYIFVTPAGLTYKPNLDSPQPDFPDLQIIGYNHNTTIGDALKDLIEIQENQPENKGPYNFSARLETDNKNPPWFKDRKTPISRAS